MTICGLFNKLEIRIKISAKKLPGQILIENFLFYVKIKFFYTGGQADEWSNWAIVMIWALFV